MNIFEEGMAKVHDMFDQVKAKVEGEDREVIEAIHQWITGAADEMRKLRLQVETMQARLSVRFAEFGVIPEVYEDEAHKLFGLTDDDMHAAGIHPDQQQATETPPAAPEATETPPAAPEATETPPAAPEAPEAPAAATEVSEVPVTPETPAAPDTPETPPAASAGPDTGSQA